MKKTLNLLPTAEKRPLETRRTLVTVVVALAIYIVALAGVWLLNDYEARNVESTIEELRSRKQRMQNYLVASAAPGAPAQTQDPGIMETMRNTPPWDAVLSELSLIVPDGIWLEIVESPDARNLRLKGYSITQADVAKLIEKLERSRYFGNVKIIFAQKGDKATTFELRMEMIWI